MRQILVTAMTIGLMVLSASAQATIGHMQMQIPFTFHANDLTLLPGTYDVDMISPALVRLANTTTKQSVIVITPLSDSGAYVSKPTLLFNRYGSDYFLSKMWFGHGSSRRGLVPTPVEQKLAKSGRPPQVESVSARP